MFNFSKPSTRPRASSDHHLHLLSHLPETPRSHPHHQQQQQQPHQHHQLPPFRHPNSQTHHPPCTDVVHHSHDLQDDDDPVSHLFAAAAAQNPLPDTPATGPKRMRACPDHPRNHIDHPEVVAPDSVPALVNDVRNMLDYVASKPSLQNGSASFLRDYLRTMLLQNAHSATEAIHAANKAHRAEVMAGRRKSREPFKSIPDETAKHIFSFLGGRDLARAREVCTRWNRFGSEEGLWRKLCLANWSALESDPAVWSLIDRCIPLGSYNCWRSIYPKIENIPKWTCRLQKTGRFVCNLVAHQISGTPVGDVGLPKVLVVERRFNIVHLQTFVLHDAAVLYFEPESEADRHGFDEFIEYLNKRTRAGLALEDQRRFIFIPPCDYTRTQINYHGRSLLGVVQNAYNPLGPL
ncbi:hypothetical protein BWQ96_10187 [Gracilariopsis chorda]|uniref:F-box domain-containing protein n=1 Tax=Gracilariopsis chorda TaxID=448386 RepID=A0A2V3IDC9_9FLOR|nr:hypothetical protein BWQ96_10187 [Gracilariopsis chorda]|eukprot:PXF40089.1 hypothetical protein BWQ96_10187 [Gracilariopsis chorda]